MGGESTAGRSLTLEDERWWAEEVRAMNDKSSNRVGDLVEPDLPG